MTEKIAKEIQEILARGAMGAYMAAKYAAVSVAAPHAGEFGVHLPHGADAVFRGTEHRSLLRLRLAMEERAAKGHPVPRDVFDVLNAFQRAHAAFELGAHAAFELGEENTGAAQEVLERALPLIRG